MNILFAKYRKKENGVSMKNFKEIITTYVLYSKFLLKCFICWGWLTI